MKKIINKTVSLLSCFALALSASFIVKADEPPNQSTVSRLPGPTKFCFDASEIEENLVKTNGLYDIKTVNPETGEGSIKVFYTPVKYKDEFGETKYIDTTMVKNNIFQRLTSGYDYRNKANSFNVQYSKQADKAIKMDDAFTMSMDSNISGILTAAQDGSGKMIYPNAFGSKTSVELTNINTGIKNDLLLEENILVNTFDWTFSSEDYLPILSEDATMVYIVKKEEPDIISYVMQPLYIYDSYQKSDNEDSSVKHFSENGKYSITKTRENSYIISSILPEDFLNSSSTVYPLSASYSINTIDIPNTLHDIDDTYVEENNTTANNYLKDYLRVGYLNGRIYTYIRFLDLGSLPANGFVTEAYLRLKFRSGQTTTAHGYCRRISSSWDGSSLRWTNRPSESTDLPYPIRTTDDSLDCDLYSFDIKDIVAGWYAGAYNNYGLRISYMNETYNDYNSFVSSDGESWRAPVLTVKYQVGTAAQGLDETGTYYIKNSRTGYYLTIPSIFSGEYITQKAKIKKEGYQMFRLQYVSSGAYYYIRPVRAYENPSLYFDVFTGSDTEKRMRSGSLVGIYNYIGGLNQKFRIVRNSNGTHRILPLCAGGLKAITTAGYSTSLGSNIAIHDYSFGYSDWIFEAVPSSSYATYMLTAEDSGATHMDSVNAIRNTMVSIGYSTSYKYKPNANEVINQLTTTSNEGIVIHGHGGKGFVVLLQNNGTNQYLYADSTNDTTTSRSMRYLNENAMKSPQIIVFISCESGTGSSSSSKSLVKQAFDKGASFSLGFKGLVAGGEMWAEYFFNSLKLGNTISSAISSADSQFRKNYPDVSISESPASSSNRVMYGETSRRFDS